MPGNKKAINKNTVYISHINLDKKIISGMLKKKMKKVF
jgi:hypothetical protein